MLENIKTSAREGLGQWFSSFLADNTVDLYNIIASTPDNKMNGRFLKLEKRNT
jgi:hypothetical protein